MGSFFLKRDVPPLGSSFQMGLPAEIWVRIANSVSILQPDGIGLLKRDVPLLGSFF